MIVAGTSWGATSKPSADEIFTLELVISDDNKPLLLANRAFIPYLVDALLLVRLHLCIVSRSAI